MQDDKEESLKKYRRLSTKLDSKFKIPKTDYRFGWDSIIGFIPTVGDGITSLLSLIIVAQAYRLNLPKYTLIRLLSNIAFDFIIGSLPLVGTLSDVAWKSNERNLEIIEKRNSTPSTSQKDKKFVFKYIIPSIVILMFAVTIGFSLLFYALHEAYQSSELLREIIKTM